MEKFQERGGIIFLKSNECRVNMSMLKKLVMRNALSEDMADTVDAPNKVGFQVLMICVRVLCFFARHD
jgi:hypothetical protein